MSTSLNEIIDGAWKHLGRSPFRRAVLGRAECARIVRAGLQHFPESDLLRCGAVEGSNEDVQARSMLESKIAAELASDPWQTQRSGFTVLVLVLAWAISGVVQFLFVRWYFDEENRKHGGEPRPVR